MDFKKLSHTDWRHAVEAAGLFGAAFLVGAVALYGWQQEILGLYIREYLAFPVVIWAVFRFGARGTAIILLIFLVYSMCAAIQGTGLLGVAPSGIRWLNFLLFNAALIVTGMSLVFLNIDPPLDMREGKKPFLAVFANNSERVHTETRLRALIETTDAIIWNTDKHLNVVFVSDCLRDILGLATENLTGKYLLALFDQSRVHEDDWKEYRDAFVNLLKNGTPVTKLIHRVRHVDGSWKWLSVSATPIFDSNHRLIEVLGVTHDIHAQKLAEEQLVQKNHDVARSIEQAVQASQAKDLLLLQQSQLAGMGEMIGNIAHQWRQPINSLGLILSDMEDAYAHGECDGEYLHSAVVQSNALIQKMSHTIDDFINFSREGKRLGIVCLLRETEACLRLISATLQHHHINITINCPHEVMVWGYANEFSQALMNLLTNAKDAIFSNQLNDGNIQIEISENSTFGVLTISDNGGGIAADILPRIFDPYFTTKQEGTGIGLYISRVAIEKNMHGSLEAKNSGRGAQFTIRLPNTKS